MKILFIRPNKDAFGFKPIGLSLLSALCKRNGHQVELFDATFYDLGFEEYSTTGNRINKFKPVDWSGYDVKKIKVDLRKEFFKTLKNYSPDICAFSVLSDERLVAMEISEYIKEYDSDIPVIWGGIYPTVAPEDAINVKTVDYICVSEGIEAFPELLNAIENKKNTTKIKNIYAKNNGVISKNEIRPLYKDMDRLPFVDWEIYDKRQFYKPFDGNVVKGGDWMSNWGCLYKCTYCINNWLNKLSGRILRRYSPERAVQELRYLKEKYAINFLRFHDEDFLMRPLEHLKEFAAFYSKEIHLPFSVEINPISVTKEKVGILKDMGIASVSMAIESGNKYIRKDILKRVDSLDCVIKAFQLFKEAGIRTVAFNMIGLPFEDREKIFDTIEVNRKASPTVADCWFFFPFEATELYDVSIKKGFYDKKEAPIYRGDYPALKLPGLTREELMSVQKCFSLYVKMPKSFYKLINRAEKNDPIGQEIFDILSTIYNKHVFDEDGYFKE
ncbi:MAG: B12-binding domain-containing radical SAM protein [Candidatus Omnitrophica bacterium]|nr:B12-binding domain-containing radical SAM protein [Candidatus Omnitrophota bacterium]